MRHRADGDERLALFRSEWPGRVTRAEVRDADPGAFRSARTGLLLLPAALLVTALWSALAFELPVAIALPGWIDWARGLLIVIALLGAILLWIFVWAMLSMPGDARRAIALARFARERGLRFARFGPAPSRIGILFAEGSARGPRGGEPLASLFRSEFALWRGSRFDEPELQIGIATYTGGKHDPKGPRHAFRFMEMPLPRRLPHLMIDARGNGGLRSLLPGTQRLSLEGDFDRWFSVYVPTGYERDALELLTPDVMACLIDYGRGWDIEVVGDRLVVGSHRFRRASDRAECTAMLRFSEVVREELGHQAEHYSDPRAARPRTQVSEAGSRLRRRSAAGATAVLVAIAAALLILPQVLGWLLDR